jgi:hypothetical protein
MVRAAAGTGMPARRIACARCGAAFACGTGGRDGGCWCGEEVTRLPLPASSTADCLCPTCLRAVAVAQPMERPS